jgi:hypothetical protein
MSPNPLHRIFQKRYARLEAGVFRYYKSSKDKDEQGAIPMAGILDVKRTTESEECLYFDVVVVVVVPQPSGKDVHDDKRKQKP